MKKALKNAPKIAGRLVEVLQYITDTSTMWEVSRGVAVHYRYQHYVQGCQQDLENLENLENNQKCEKTLKNGKNMENFEKNLKKT